MNRFFHAYTKKYLIRFRYAAAITVTPLAELSMMAIWTALFNMKRISEPQFVLPLALMSAGAVAAGMVLCWIYYELAVHYEKRSAKYTYFDISCKTAVFSRYAGEYTSGGRRIVIRKLYVIPLKNYGNAYLDEKRRHLVLVGEIRCYKGDSDALGYHFRDGELVFNKWWNDETNYTTVNMLKLPMDFERPGRIAKALHEAKEEFDAIPEKKPYVFREADIVKKRRELKKMAELMRYERKW